MVYTLLLQSQRYESCFLCGPIHTSLLDPCGLSSIRLLVTVLYLPLGLNPAGRQFRARVRWVRMPSC